VAALEELPGVRQVGCRDVGELSVLDLILEEEAALGGVINKLNQSHVKIERLDKHAPTLEDVFVRLVGRSMDEVEKEASDANGK
jgi:ABC-2 type transport system ATP-binding protein